MTDTERLLALMEQTNRRMAARSRRLEFATWLMVTAVLMAAASVVWRMFGGCH